jgi:hypothetical protein
MPYADSNGDPIEVISHLPEGAGWGDCPEDGVLRDRMTCKPECKDGLVLRDQFRCDDGYLAKRCATPQSPERYRARALYLAKHRCCAAIEPIC